MSKDKNNLRAQLLLSNNRLISKILIDAFELKNLSSTKTENHYLDKNNNFDIFFLFNSYKPSEEDIIQIYKTKVYNNIKVFCIENPTFPRDLNCNFNIIDLNEIFNKLTELNITIPTQINIENKPKLSLKTILCTVFNSKKSKGYFWFGVMLIFSSLFTPFQTYYIISGTILILLSIFSRFNKIYN